MTAISPPETPPLPTLDFIFALLKTVVLATKRCFLFFFYLSFSNYFTIYIHLSNDKTYHSIDNSIESVPIRDEQQPAAVFLFGNRCIM